MITDFSVRVATVNGSGSQSANQILVRSLFRMGLPVGAKNLFPSNIAGLPTWFTIRVSDQGFTSRTEKSEILVAMNAETALADLQSVGDNGIYIYNSEMKLNEASFADSSARRLGIPFKEIVADVSDSVRLKKLLVNMAYVGVLAEFLKIPEDILESAISHQFKGKESVIAPNRQAVLNGRKYVRENLQGFEFPYGVVDHRGANDDKVLMDGNTASALGLVFGGCTVAAWYPITPSSSLVENFAAYAEKYRKPLDGKNDFLVVQAEDELASISMVIGAGWSGARAMTATSGPGLSLMAEAAGLAYYAEVPSVIWNVQRVGPSTGLPTRTMQGDLMSAYYLSHGDTKHVVLLPGGPKDCFEFGQTAFDLAERLQTLVIVLSDLDLGMNLHISERPVYPEKPFDRGKVLTLEQLEGMADFGRYKDVDGDGIPFRALPGTENTKAGYFTRGSGHDEYGAYSENNLTYKANVDRLARKFDTARALVPAPLIARDSKARVGMIYFGSTSECIPEVRSMLNARGVANSSMQLRALPLHKDVVDFISSHDRIYVIEQNRDAQLMGILRHELPEWAGRLKSVLQYDGLPLTAFEASSQILKQEGN